MIKFTIAALLFYIPLRAFAQELPPQYPIVPGFGGIYAIPEVEKNPDTTLTYRIVINVAQGAEKSDEINPALNNIARMLNLHGVGGVPQNQIEVVAVIHALATPTVLANDAYREKFGCDNPNDALIQALDAAGVSLFVCGQSLLARGFYPQPLHENITISISALTILTEYQQKGYALLRF